MLVKLKALTIYSENIYDTRAVFISMNILGSGRLAVLREKDTGEGKYWRLRAQTNQRKDFVVDTHLHIWYLKIYEAFL